MFKERRFGKRRSLLNDADASVNGEIDSPSGDALAVVSLFASWWRRKLVSPRHRPYTASMSYLDRVTFNPNQCGGRPCIRGMRIRVKDILEMLASGASEAEILESFPYLEREDIQAALEYAARQADHAVLSLAQ